MIVVVVMVSCTVRAVTAVVVVVLDEQLWRCGRRVDIPLHSTAVCAVDGQRFRRRRRNAQMMLVLKGGARSGLGGLRDGRRGCSSGRRRLQLCDK